MKNENYIKEKKLDNQPKAIDQKETNILLDLLKNVCKIFCNKGGYGTGFFCKIPIGLGRYLTALMTNNHILNIDDIQLGKTINFSINNDEKEYNILIDNTRKTYTNENYDITIIEIKENDEINEKSFFSLDEQIFQGNYDKISRNSQIYMIHYPKEKEKKISDGIIKDIINDDKGNKTIHYLCENSLGSSGAPIINKTNFQVIGIHKRAEEIGKNYNLGILLKDPIEKFNKEIKIKINNKNYNLRDNKNNFLWKMKI